MSMKISDLAATTGVSRATLKYYLREGLLHPGVAINRTQADYDESHVQRVRLVRALIEVGGLHLAAVKNVIGALESPPENRHHLLGIAQDALTGGSTSPPQEDSRAAGLMQTLGWSVEPDSALLSLLDRQLDASDAAGVPVPDERLQAYAHSMHDVARADVDSVPADPEDAVRQVVVATVLVDAILITLRRLGQQDVSSRRFDTP